MIYVTALWIAFSLVVAKISSAHHVNSNYVIAYFVGSKCYWFTNYYALSHPKLLMPQKTAKGIQNEITVYCCVRKNLSIHLYYKAARAFLCLAFITYYVVN